MLLFLLKCPPRLWGKPEFAPTAVISFIPLLFMIDCLLNGMINQGYIIFAGGASGLVAKYGMAGLEQQTLSDKNTLTVGRPPHQSTPRTQRNLGTLRFPEPKEGGTPTALGVRSLINPVLSGNAGRGKKQSTGIKTKALNYVGPRNLQYPGNNTTELMSRRWTTQGQTDPPEDQKNGLSEKTRNNVDADTETGWVRRI